MKFSVIVPMYNVENYICECINSVIHQTYDDWELILVNDGSRDRSGEIAYQYSVEYSDRIIFLEHENKGSVYTRHMGINQATGDYILFLDADDWWDKGLLEEVNRMIEKYHADIVQFEFVDFLDNFTNREYEILDKSELVCRILSYTPSLANRAFRKRLFSLDESVYEQYYDVKMGNDMLQLAHPLCQALSACFSPKELYNYRILPNSTCHAVNIEKVLSLAKSVSWVWHCVTRSVDDTPERRRYLANRLSDTILNFYPLIYNDEKEIPVKKIYSLWDSMDTTHNYLKLMRRHTKKHDDRLYPLIIWCFSHRLIWPIRCLVRYQKTTIGKLGIKKYIQTICKNIA